MRTLLIANRGEIACRVIATARRMSLRTVAVHSDADAGAAHVALADEAVRIGPPPVAESYLDQDAILAAALESGADAIHPGYGFLSENPGFVRRVEEAGITFVGPPASAIEAMGLKDAAKARMEEAGVPVVPGYHGADQSTGALAAAAERVGYPVLIKARAGGGGKGMRRVDAPAAFADALAACQREGKASFGDPAVLIEKYVTSPRHIEIQIFADGHGNAVHLFERDCSLQRRHQKVIEEAPAPDMPPDVREAMGAAAVQAARAIGYVGAGTVEFIADGSGALTTDGFWFMEMNTRLQVEHPVSEAITGHDFVEWQIRIASGAPLPAQEEDLAINGHAIEARLYAEDVARGFLPATGPLRRLAFPDHAAFATGPLRIDSGVREGDEIAPHYDPMIAKVIAHGPDRESARARLLQALAAIRIAGTTTNLGFLHRLVSDPGFAAGDVDTGLIERRGAALADDPTPSPAARAIAALAIGGFLDPPAGSGPWDTLAGFRLWGPARQSVRLDDETLTVTITAPGRFEIDGIGAVVAARSGPDWSVTLDGLTRTLGLVADPHLVTVFEDGAVHRIARPDPLATTGTAAAEDSLTAPMPGLVKLVRCALGDRVTAGQPLLVLEAMKMEHTLRAPRDGEVTELRVVEGAQVADGDRLLALTPTDE